MQSLIIKHQKLLIFLGIVAFFYVSYKISYPTYTWNQKLTVEVETPEGIISSGSVISARMVFSPTFGLGQFGGGFKSSFQGEATVLALPDGKFYLYY